ncbi:MAG: hypothetical protein H6745_19170 [Deltaproteobacteria bacterium]|nr:hypothetical protein [Deltaproteobacteria bacterium]
MSERRPEDGHEGRTAPSDRPADGAPAAKKKRRRRPKRRPTDAAPARPDAPASADDHARRALGALRDLARAVAAEAGETGRLPIETLQLALDVPLDGQPLGDAAQGLVASLRDRLGDAIRGASAFREGHVYDFFTDSAESSYSRPPGPTHVFAGFAANGKPMWETFPNVCLARKEPRVDRLWAEPPEVIAIVQRGDELSTELLPEFGRGSLAYAVLGQVALGLLPRNLDPQRPDGDRVALTLQIVETTQGTERHRLRFNALGLMPIDIAFAAADADARSPAEAFRQILRAARQRVDALGKRVAQAGRRGEKLDRDELVRQILSRLRADVNRVWKVRSYRTQHAASRHQSGERPTGVALADARSAGDGRLLRDTHRETIIVLGPKSRAHVFTAAGRHVTSLQLAPGEAERKTDKGRWRPLDRAIADDFRRAVDSSGE